MPNDLIGYSQALKRASMNSRLVQRTAVAALPSIVWGAQPSLSDKRKHLYAATVDLEELRQDFEKIAGKGEADAAMAEVVHDAAYQVASLAAIYAPKKTGELSRSMEVVFFRKGLEAEISANTPYAAFQEYGTASRGEYGGMPYVIEVKQGKALNLGGRYYKKVIHPGIPPRPYMRPALMEVVQGNFAGALADKLVEMTVNTPAARRANQRAQRMQPHRGMANSYAPQVPDIPS